MCVWSALYEMGTQHIIATFVYYVYVVHMFVLVADPKGTELRTSNATNATNSHFSRQNPSMLCVKTPQVRANIILTRISITQIATISTFYYTNDFGYFRCLMLMKTYNVCVRVFAISYRMYCEYWHQHQALKFDILNWAVKRVCEIREKNVCEHEQWRNECFNSRECVAHEDSVNSDQQQQQQLSTASG